jgi:hypothetical protein
MLKESEEDCGQFLEQKYARTRKPSRAKLLGISALCFGVSVLIVAGWWKHWF